MSSYETLLPIISHPPPHPLQREKYEDGTWPALIDSLTNPKIPKQPTLIFLKSGRKW